MAGYDSGQACAVLTNYNKVLTRSRKYFYDLIQLIIRLDQKNTQEKLHLWEEICKKVITNEVQPDLVSELTFSSQYYLIYEEALDKLNRFGPDVAWGEYHRDITQHFCNQELKSFVRVDQLREETKDNYPEIYDLLSRLRLNLAKSDLFDQVRVKSIELIDTISSGKSQLEFQKDGVRSGEIKIESEHFSKKFEASAIKILALAISVRENAEQSLTAVQDFSNYQLFIQIADLRYEFDLVDLVVNLAPKQDVGFFENMAGFEPKDLSNWAMLTEIIEQNRYQYQEVVFEKIPFVDEQVKNELIGMGLLPSN